MTNISNEDKLILGDLHGNVVKQLIDGGFANQEAKLHPFFLWSIGKMEWDDMITTIANTLEEDIRKNGFE